MTHHKHYGFQIIFYADKYQIQIESTEQPSVCLIQRTTKSLDAMFPRHIQLHI